MRTQERKAKNLRETNHGASFPVELSLIETETVRATPHNRRSDEDDRKIQRNMKDSSKRTRSVFVYEQNRSRALFRFVFFFAIVTEISFQFFLTFSYAVIAKGPRPPTYSRIMREIPSNFMQIVQIRFTLIFRVLRHSAFDRTAPTDP